MEKERYKVKVSNDLETVGVFDLQENEYVVNERVMLLGTAHLLCDLFNRVDKQYTKIKELETQVEKWKQEYENCSKLEKNLTKEHQYCLDNWRACEKENQQLKEKYDNLYKCYQKTSQEDLKDKYDLAEENEGLKRSQNVKAIKVLEDLKDFNRHCVFGNIRTENYINNQIKELRSGK